MGGQGRGSAVLAVVLLCVLAHCEIARAATNYVVGDSSGWTFNMDSWPAGKTFRAGDVLIFRYNRLFHNTVKVSPGGYRSCSVPRGVIPMNSGNDRVTLVKGVNSFICSIMGHCQAGMKIQVVAH